MPVSPRVSVLLANFPEAASILALGRRLDQLGFRRVWLAENNGADAAVAGGALAVLTSMEIGTAIVPVYSRTPALLTMMATTLAHIGGADRKIHLGIGAGGQVTIERWHGLPFDHPLGTTRDTLAIMREALAGEKTSVTGSARRSTGFKSSIGPAPSVSLYIGGMGPKLLELAAEKADGLIVTWLSPRILKGFAQSFGDSVERYGRRREDVTLVARAYVAVTKDVERVREAVRQEMVEYVVSPGYGRYFASVGFADVVSAVNEAFRRGDRVATAQAISDELLDDVLIVGDSAAAISDRLRAHLDNGADDLMVQPVPAYRGGDPLRTVEAVAEVFAD